MRPIVLALALVGCATASTPPEGAELQALTPAQLEEAFEGRAACFVEPEDGACGTIVIAESTSPTVWVTREVGATDIVRFIDEPMAQFVRQLLLYQQYEELFARLEAQRARGDFRYIKEVTISQMMLDAQTNRWCSRTERGARFEDVQYYYSNRLSADVTGDERLDPDSERELRAFQRAVIADSQFRAELEQRARKLSETEMLDDMLGVLDGVKATCVSYGGVVRNGRIELRSATFVVGGRPAPWLGSAVTPYALDGELPLRASY